jgi:gas vesicle protein GvpO
MASTSKETTSRQGTAEPVEEQGDSVEQNGSNQSEALAAAKRAAATAAAAALAGALVGAGKAFLDRRASSDGPDTDEAAVDEDSDEPVETEASSAPSAADDQSGPADESDDPPAETTGQGEGYEEEEEEDEEEDAHADPAARREETDSDDTEDDDSTERDQPQSGASGSNVAKIVERARSHAHDLLGEEPESVTGIDRSNGSWTVTLEVVELHRVPDTTDVMGAYEIVLDDDGNLVRFDRTARYVRSQVEDVS